MRVTVSPAWLKACGMDRYIGQSLKVLRTYQGGGWTFYEVELDYGYVWTVSDMRDISVSNTCEYQSHSYSLRY